MRLLLCASCALVVAACAKAPAARESGRVEIDESPIDFGLTTLGACASRAVRVVNNSSQQVLIANITPSGPFGPASDQPPSLLVARGESFIALAFCPRAVGPASGSIALTLAIAGVGEEHSIAVSGTGDNVACSAIKPGLDFGYIQAYAPAIDVFRLVNSSPVASQITIRGIEAVSAADEAAFALFPPVEKIVALPAASSTGPGFVDIRIVFVPKAVREYRADLVLENSGTCSGRYPLTGTGFTDPRFPEPCPELACSTPIDVRSAQDVLAAAGTRWGYARSFDGGCRAPSAELLAVADLELTPADVAAPPGCTEDWCSPTAKLWISGAVPGVTGQVVGQNIQSVAIATGTRFRVRLELADYFSEEYQAGPLVSVLPSCAAPCASGEVRCEANQTCWSDAFQHCLHCLGGEARYCACFAIDAVLVDGTECTWSISPDLHCSGQCVGGECVDETNPYCGQ